MMATRDLYFRQKYRRPPVSGEQDDDSDAEESQLGLKRTDGLETQIIHSGHFMVSSPHIEHPPKKGYDFDTVNEQTCLTYRFGKASTSHFSIDASLTKLFECMTLAYSGELVSPKWKNFKGLKLLWRDKIRLNNAIWRAWYMQYVEKRENPVCHFVTPLSGYIQLEVHRPTEAVPTDVRCRKHRIEIVIREYHKWRTYFKKRLQRHKDDDLSSLLKDEDIGVRRVPRRSTETPSPMEMDMLFDMDVLMSEFTDTLFSTLTSHHSIALPNPREIAHAGNADMIQPGLIPLQPNLDFMDSFDPLQDLFHSLRQPIFPSVSPTASSVTPLPNSSSQSQVQLIPSLQLAADQISPPDSLSVPSPMSSQTSETGDPGDVTFVENYMPLFAGQMAPTAQEGISSQPLSRDSLAQCRPAQDLVSAPPLIHTPLDSASTLGERAVPPVVTHTALSIVTSSDATTTFSHNSDYCSMSAQPSHTPLPPLAPLTASSIQNPQTFALPRPIQSSSANKIRPLQRIAPATTLPAPHLILTGSFPSHANAVIVSPTPLKPDVVPTTGVVLVPSCLGGKTLHPLVPKEQTHSSSCKNLEPSTSSGHGHPVPGQGSSCGLEQVSSPQSPISSSSGNTTLVKNEPHQCRRVTHISAEQKRRLNINIGFKTLGNLVPALKSQSNITNAVTLQRTVEHIGKLQQERQQLQEEAKRLQEEIEELTASINLCHEQLPATGAPIARHCVDHMQEKFDAYVKNRTLQNWKFWIFSIIIKPLFESFNGMVSTVSTEELCQTTLQWLVHHCSLPMLRPMVLNTLCHLSTTTSILSDPSLLPEEAIRAISNNSNGDV